MNAELGNVQQFCNDFGMDINPSKSEAIIISSSRHSSKIQYSELPPIMINGRVIEYTDSVRSLGYVLNRTLTSDTHINQLQQKAYGALGSLRPLKNILSSNVKTQLVKTMIFPIFDYMDIIYHGFGIHGTNRSSDKLERTFNTCIRYNILNLPRREHITEHRNNLNFLTMYDRRTLHVALMIYKIINGGAPEYLDNIVTRNTNNTRSNDKLIIHKAINNMHKTSLRISGSTMWNSFPDDIRNSASIKIFTSNLENYLSGK